MEDPNNVYGPTPERPATTYIRQLPYEFPYSRIAATPDSIHANQDALMVGGIDRRNNNAADLRAGATMEGAAFARTRLALRQYLNLVTGQLSYYVGNSDYVGS